MSQREIIDFLKAVIRTMECLNEEEYYNLLSGQGDLVYKQRVKRSAKVPKDDSNDDYIDVIARLKLVSNRDEGKEILDQEVKLKKDLIGLAKQIQVYVNKSDTKERVREKIIEALVGTKLANKAIGRVKLK